MKLKITNRLAKREIWGGLIQLRPVGYRIKHEKGTLVPKQLEKGTLVPKQLNDIFLYPITARKRLNDSPLMW